MANLFEYIISIKDKASASVEKINGSVKDTDGNVNKLQNSIGQLAKKILPVIAVGTAIVKIKQYAEQSVAVYAEQSEAVNKLGQVMRNTMAARQDDIDSILKLTKAQENLGVISDNVQLAGTQELATYLTRKDSIEKLLPAMNDMLAQQYGLNATSEQAVTIASMLGKVMDGQVGALSRYGYAFDDAQAHILKTGTEAQRAAVLFDVVNSAVGGVNKKLLETPEGKLKQSANQAQELQERMGRLFTVVAATWSKVGDARDKIIGGLIGWFERHEELIVAFVDGIASAASSVFNAVFVVLKLVRDAFGWFIDKIREGNPWIVGLAVTIGSVTAALILMQAWQMAVALWSGIVAAAKTVWTAASWALNISLLANPVFWIVAGIIALIAAIAWVIVAFDGWGAAWDSLMKGLQYTWHGFTGAFKLLWLQTVDVFMHGVELIEAAWYKVKSLWDEEGASEGLAKLNAEAEKRSRAIAYQKGLNQAYDNIARDAFGNIVGENGLHRNSNTLSGAANKIKGALMPGMSPHGGGGGGAGADDKTNQTREAIATGGTKNTTINIQIGKQIETLTLMTGNLRESAEKIRDVVIEEMTRAVAMTGALAG